MRKFKIALMSIVCAIIAALFVTEAFAAVLVNLSITGDVVYVSNEIGADIFGTYRKSGQEAIANTYLSISGHGSTDSDGVYTIEGSEDSYVAHTSAVGTIPIYSESDELTFYIFIKNTGDRNIMPVIETESKSSDINFSIQKYFFDISNSQTDYIEVKRGGATAPTLITQVEGETAGVDYGTFLDNQSLEKLDVFMAKIVITVDNVTNVTQYANFGLIIGLVSDIQYNNPNILTVRQENNIVATAWEKIGQNRYLSATAIKGNTDDLGKIEAAYNGRNTNATLTEIDSNLTYLCDDYDTAAVYKDIDVVNVDIATGELIGYLSDLSYDFEWFGGDVTLPAGTTLASGRTLESSETFTVDVYARYPTFYARRWVIAGTSPGGGAATFTYISISDEPFAGSVEISEYYVAITEMTMFNPDGTVAHNSNGIFLRSYVYPWAAGSAGSATHLINNYGFSTYTGVTSNTTQEQYLTWQNNLTIDWQAYATAHPTLKTASKAVGEDYRAFAYEMLYLVKYANFNSQDQIGLGNVNTRPLYNGKLKNTSNVYNLAAEKNVSYSSGADSSRIEASKGGGVIGLRGTAGGTTGTSSYNSFGMAYGYNSSVAQLYEVDFLVYNNGQKRILRDGYIGSDQYTSVCLLGRFNPWGNLSTWICGTVTLKDSYWCYIQLEDYDGTNYYLSTTTPSESTLANDYGYAKVSYNIPSTKTVRRYLGTSGPTTDNSRKNALLTLVALPTNSASSAASDGTTGICDGYWPPDKSQTTGIFWGGAAHNTTDAGLFYNPCDAPIAIYRGDYGFRGMLL